MHDVTPPADLDATRAAVAARDLVATASGYLTGDVAMSLDFEELAPFKNLIKRFFSTEVWTDEEVTQLSDLVAPHVAEGWWEHDLGGGIILSHGIREGGYHLSVSGASSPATSIFDRVFDGPVVPEATPHPRKVKFTFGGAPSPGRWYRRHDPAIGEDRRVERIMAEPDVTDVMVAGSFVTIGISTHSSWERRLEPLLALVGELFAPDERAAPPRTREELLAEAAGARSRSEELHLLDPDEPEARSRLLGALDDTDPRTRRIAVAILVESNDEELRRRAVTRGLADGSRIVRRTAVDAAADTEDEWFRYIFEEMLYDDDPWIRWKAVRSLGHLGLAGSRTAVEALADDPDFQVRFEVAAVLRRGD